MNIRLRSFIVVAFSSLKIFFYLPLRQHEPRLFEHCHATIIMVHSGGCAIRPMFKLALGNVIRC